jgi:hypothetical protein
MPSLCPQTAHVEIVRFCSGFCSWHKQLSSACRHSRCNDAVFDIQHKLLGQYFDPQVGWHSDSSQSSKVELCLEVSLVASVVRVSENELDDEGGVSRSCP